MNRLAEPISPFIPGIQEPAKVQQPLTILFRLNFYRDLVAKPQFLIIQAFNRVQQPIAVHFRSNFYRDLVAKPQYLIQSCVQ